MRVCSICQRCYDDSASLCDEAYHPALSETLPGGTEMVPGYRLEYAIESSIDGDRYQANQIASGQPCLIRIVSADIAGDRFLSEAESTAAFFHPNVVDVFETGELGSGERFVVSEAAGGQTLHQFLNDVRVPELLTSIRIIRQTAEALHALHLRDLTHRAINPENILLTTGSDGSYVARIQNPDLGGVRQQAVISNKFLIDTYLDSLKYFSPEQCMGEAAGPAADVYGLGVVFYEMLSGAPPFDAAKAVGLIEKHRSQPVPDVKIHNFDLRMLVTHSLMESLQKHPTSRHSSANVLARQLRHIEQLATHVLTPPPAGVVPVHPPRSPVPSIVVPPPVLLKPIQKADVPIVAESYAVSTAVEAPAITVADQVVAMGIQPEIVPMLVAGFETSVIEDSPVTEPISQQPVLASFKPETKIYVPLRSRLKQWKSKLQVIAARLIIESPTADVSPEVEPAEQRRLLPIDLPPVLSNAAEIPTELVLAEPKKIELELPVEDIPSVHDVRTVLAKEAESHQEPPTVDLPIPVVERPVIATATRVPDIIRPARVALPPVTIAAPIAADRVRSPKAVPAKTQKRKEEVAQGLAGAKVQKVRRIKFDAEEITLVRAPSKRIRIDWDRVVARPDLATILPAPSRSYSVAGEIAFVPTILGGASRKEAAEPEQREGMFASFDGPPRSRLAVHRRSIVIGGGFSLLIGLFLFGNDSVTRYFQRWSSADSATAPATEEASLPPVSRLKLPAKRNVVKTGTKTKSEKISSGVSATDRSKTSAENKREAILSSAVRARTNAESTKRSTIKASPSAAGKSTQSTRPRIVKN